MHVTMRERCGSLLWYAVSGTSKGEVWIRKTARLPHMSCGKPLPLKETSEGSENMIMTILSSILAALFMAFNMFWEILWPLVLGFALSGIVQAVVSHQSIAKA